MTEREFERAMAEAHEEADRAMGALVIGLAALLGALLGLGIAAALGFGLGLVQWS